MAVVDREDDMAARREVAGKGRVVAGHAALPGAAVDLHDDREAARPGRPVNVERQCRTVRRRDRNATADARLAGIDAEQQRADVERPTTWCSAGVRLQRLVEALLGPAELPLEPFVILHNQELEFCIFAHAASAEGIWDGTELPCATGRMIVKREPSPSRLLTSIRPFIAMIRVRAS